MLLQCWRTFQEWEYLKILVLDFRDDSMLFASIIVSNVIKVFQHEPLKCMASTFNYSPSIIWELFPFLMIFHHLRIFDDEYLKALHIFLPSAIQINATKFFIIDLVTGAICLWSSFKRTNGKKTLFFVLSTREKLEQNICFTCPGDLCLDFQINPDRLCR